MPGIDGMRRAVFFICLAAAIWAMFFPRPSTADRTYEAKTPFSVDSLRPAKSPAGGEPLYNPKNPYFVSIHYELGMHCVGFEMTYCCIIPPYNSIQSQVVLGGANGERPRLLSPEDGVRPYYAVRDNTYSEGNKMRYWGAPKDVTGRGAMNEPNDNMANYVWTHLFIYSDLNGTVPADPRGAQRRHIGKEIPVNTDSGPSGKPVSGGYMDYAAPKGGNIVFTDSLLAGLGNVPLTLTASHLWDALGLPLTAFNDSNRKGSLRTISDLDFQPYQYAVVQLRDRTGRAVIAGGKPVEFFGTEPVDISNCSICHSGQGIAASLSRGGGLSLFDKEYAYWKARYPDASEYFARLASASILVLELHDKRHKTHFLKDYDADAATNRLGRTGPVNCADCHGDNMSGNLQVPRPGTTGYQGLKGPPLTEAVHRVHARFAKMPDGGGRTQNCQACHPTHWQRREMNDFRSNPFQIVDELGNPRFSDKDVRMSGGGCFLRRDAHTNPGATPPFFLNGIGRWYLTEVSMKDEKGVPIKGMRGLYCTNCHNHLAHELYSRDDLRDVASQTGQTLRNRPIGEVIRTVAAGDPARFKSFFADPVVQAAGEPLHSFYAERRDAPAARLTPETNGGFSVEPWNGKNGKAVGYRAISGGADWWLASGEPHCADCHVAPFVESQGGRYFPIDQPNKYSLYRYSKAHGVIACQACHQSMHGLYPVRYEGAVRSVDITTREQALQFSPDGKYEGPVTCAACHTVNKAGVPAQLRGTDYYRDYWASVVLIHFMREGDEKLPLPSLMQKYSYTKSSRIAADALK